MWHADLVAAVCTLESKGRSTSSARRGQLQSMSMRPFITVTYDLQWPRGFPCANLTAGSFRNAGSLWFFHLVVLAMSTPFHGQSYLQLNLTVKGILSSVAQNQASLVRNLYAKNRGSGLLSIQANPSLPYLVSAVTSRTLYPYCLSLKLSLIHGAP